MRIAGTSLKPFEIWRRDVRLDHAREFGSSLLASAVRLGSGAAVRGLGPRPKEALILYELESCPYSRLVREALCELDLDVLVKPCPVGEYEHRLELDQLGQTAIPFLIDRSAGLQLAEAGPIVEHLYERYGDGSPVPVRLRGRWAEQSSELASRLRGGQLRYEKPARKPELTVELWNYEASPYCRRVREAFGRWGLPYACHNLARQSPRRKDFRARFGLLQFPRLYDPNTGIGMFESESIIAYLRSQCAQVPITIGSVANAYPA